MGKKINTCNTLRNIFLMRIRLAVQKTADWMIAKGLANRARRLKNHACTEYFFFMRLRAKSLQFNWNRNVININHIKGRTSNFSRTISLRKFFLKIFKYWPHISLFNRVHDDEASSYSWLFCKYVLLSISIFWHE